MANIKTMGIIGGGQLGMMMAEAAKKLGIKCFVLDPNPNCSCAYIAKELIVGAYDDMEKLEELCKKSDVITYEFENVPYTVIKDLKKQYNIPQGEMPLYYSQDRLREKEAAVAAGAMVAEYRSVFSKAELDDAVKELGFPSVLKSRSGGYDGKGQVVINSTDDMPTAYALVKTTPCLLEKFVNFNMEVSIIMTKGIKKGMTSFPVTQNIHKNNILHMSIAPAPLTKTVATKVEILGRKLMKNLNFVGTLAIEFFIEGNNIIFNEMAPRPHNSGHHTIESCETSQFEQHIRAITDMTLGKTELLDPAIMVNYLGQHVEGIVQLKKMKLPNITIHDYKKDKALTNRKMGHVTFLDYDKKILDNIVNRYW